MNINHTPNNQHHHHHLILNHPATTPISATTSTVTPASWREHHLHMVMEDNQPHPHHHHHHHHHHGVLDQAWPNYHPIIFPTPYPSSSSSPSCLAIHPPPSSSTLGQEKQDNHHHHHHHVEDDVRDHDHHHHHHDQEEEEEEEKEELGAMKEMMYRIAVMQPVDIDPATIRKPKRRNVRISDDPQSVAARLRRERISEKIRILQRLVPGGTKMDTSSMLDEAIRYVKFLKRQIRLLQSTNNSAPFPAHPGWVGLAHIPLVGPGSENPGDQPMERPKVVLRDVLQGVVFQHGGN